MKLSELVQSVIEVVDTAQKVRQEQARKLKNARREFVLSVSQYSLLAVGILSVLGGIVLYLMRFFAQDVVLLFTGVGLLMLALIVGLAKYSLAEVK